MVGNRLPAVALSADPGGRREWSRDCKENRRGSKDGASGFWRPLGLSGTPVGRRTLTVNGGLRGDTREVTLLLRGLVSVTLGLNSFLTRPPNRLTLPRNVRLPTKILAACGECSCRSPYDHGFVTSTGRLSSSSRSTSGVDGLLGEGRYVATLSPLCVPGQLFERESGSCEEDGDGKEDTSGGEKCAESGEWGSRRSRTTGEGVRNV
jgi:hypothetical protein